jgi:predicted class III extradiol MEMO1 family dioxygenase
VRSIRHPAVAGTFYPADPQALRAQVRACLAEGRRRQAARIGGLRPKALVVPHAGYVYSGPVAGSHYRAARALDRATSAAIEALRPEDLGHECACGGVPLRGLLVAARTHGLTPHTLDLRSSGDTAGPRDQVVGYGAYAFV